MKRISLETAVTKNIKTVYLTEYAREVFVPYTIGAKSEDGLTYSLVAENGTQWRYYWDQVVYVA